MLIYGRSLPCWYQRLSTSVFSFALLAQSTLQTKQIISTSYFAFINLPRRSFLFWQIRFLHVVTVPTIEWFFSSHLPLTANKDFASALFGWKIPKGWGKEVKRDQENLRCKAMERAWLDIRGVRWVVRKAHIWRVPCSSKVTLVFEEVEAHFPLQQLYLRIFQTT